MADLDFLTQETLNFSKEHADFVLDESFVFEQTEPESSVIEYPDAPGIIYRLHHSGPTFSLRGFATDSISDSFESIEAGEKSLLRALRTEDKVEEVCFYELASVELAQMLFDQLFNKRFPSNEDLLCNISDPGFSWWYSSDELGFRINFKSHKFEGSGQRLRLGPIGDVVIANYRLKQLEVILKEHLPLNEFICSEKQFILKTTDGRHPLLMELKQIFEQGELSSDSALLSEAPLNVKLYFRELATIRKFWLFLEVEMGKNCNTIN